ncbi:MAG: DUF6569 family protein [Thermovirgaceae bacterium]|jgi:hypothetical protein|nr:hypothetical protein [Synergistales bacterium]MDI9393875.1 hypothetical protein [Synergistota bacterium]MDY0178795.1 hypothetical protein [Synergistaceae bacterium]MDD3830252.1 hypothetical protein [Synergistales bacterium]MDD4022623.1 hypothetical protein [Synergistales bacterium]
MKTVIESFFNSLKTGEPCSFKGLTAFPVFSALPEAVDFVTLTEAFREDWIEIRELTQGGSVPELLVINKSDRNILILDSEELQGAKQNRVLNITVLVTAWSKVVVPVSCTERGRWHYISNVFRDSGTMASRSVRFSKNRSVGESLRRDNSFRSDQMEVWDKVDELSMRSGTMSRTHAMRDVFVDMDEKLRSFEKAFPLSEGQRGVIFFAGKEPAGFEYVSDPRAFRDLFPKILRSYAVEAPPGEAKTAKALSGDQAMAFVGKVLSAETTVKHSAGRGEDIRFSGDGVTGSALAYEGEILHAVFFPDEKEGRPVIRRRPVS